jgi:hypothetical protein
MVGIGLAFYTLPKRSVTGLGSHKKYKQDLDARRKITTITKRSFSNNNNNCLYLVTEQSVTSLIIKRVISPAVKRGAFYLCTIQRTDGL